MRALAIVLGLTLAAPPIAVAAAACPPPPVVTTATAEDWLACIDPLLDGAVADIRILSADDMEGRAPATNGSARARAYIVERLTAIGVEPYFPGFEQRFTFEDEDDNELDGVNLVAKLPGTGSDPRLIVMTAHYDHLGLRRGDIYNGADDNASGVAALLAIAAVLRQAPPEHTVVLAFVDAEEIGFHGSFALVREGLPVPGVALNINLDMVSKGTDGELFAMGGYINSSIRALIGSLPALPALRLVQAHDNADDDEYDDWTNESDQFAFHRAGIPWLYFANEEHDEYHEPEDDFSTVQPAFFRDAIATALAALRLADARLDAIGPADQLDERPRPGDDDED